MLKTANPAYQPMNFFTGFNIRSFGSENEMFTYDQDYAGEKRNGFGTTGEMHKTMNAIYEKEKKN